MGRPQMRGLGPKTRHGAHQIRMHMLPHVNTQYMAAHFQVRTNSAELLCVIWLLNDPS
jgi:hypothetical protein